MGREPEYQLPDEIMLTLGEASTVLLALYDLRDALSEPGPDRPDGDRLLRDVNDAILIVQRKLVPDFPE